MERRADGGFRKPARKRAQIACLRASVQEAPAARRSMTVAAHASILALRVNGHRLTLLFEHVPDGSCHVLTILGAQPARASVACPALTLGPVETRLIESAAGVRFEIMHDLLRPNFRPHDCMEVIRSYMGCHQVPATVFANAQNGAQDNQPLRLIHPICRLILPLLLRQNAPGIRRYERVSVNTMLRIDRSDSLP